MPPPRTVRRHPQLRTGAHRAHLRTGVDSCVSTETSETLRTVYDSTILYCSVAPAPRLSLCPSVSVHSAPFHIRVECGFGRAAERRAREGCARRWRRAAGAPAARAGRRRLHYTPPTALATACRTHRCACATATSSILFFFSLLVECCCCRRRRRQNEFKTRDCNQLRSRRAEPPDASSTHILYCTQVLQVLY